MIPIAHAQSGAAAAQCLVDKINEVFLFPLIALLSAIAFLVFLYGAFQYVRNSDSQEGRQTGQRHLLYGVIGLLVMFSAYTILQIAAGTFGVSTTVGPSQLAPCSSERPPTRPSGPSGVFSDDIGGFGSLPAADDRSPGAFMPGGDDSIDRTSPDMLGPTTLGEAPVFVDRSPVCSPGTILVSGRCITPDAGQVDPSVREAIAAQFLPAINEQIANGNFNDVIEWYDPTTLADQQSRVNMIQNVWPDRCDSLNGDMELIDTGSGGIWICVQ